MAESDVRFDVAVLGGGPAGYVAALVAAQRGAQVALVEKGRVGGTCLNVGCIPTKALTTATELLLNSRRAGELGLSIPQAEVDLPRLMGYKQGLVDQLVAGVEQLLNARRIRLIRGSAHLVRPDALLVQGERWGGIELPAANVVLAPGSIPAESSIEGRHLPGVITSTEALDISKVPARLVIIGGGVIGVEFACIYEALGSRVAILEMSASILPSSTDDAIAKRLQVLFRRRGMDVHTGTTVRRIESKGDSLQVIASSAGEETTFEADQVLLATGRWPNTSGLGLAELGIRMNGRAIAVDDCLATNVGKLWAIGDAVGGPMLAHKAMVEGRIAVDNIFGAKRRVDHRACPNVIYSRPEVASVGWTELQAREAGADIKVSQFPFSANPRARILGEVEGLVRLICEVGTGRVLGVHLLGPHATDLIAEGALAVQTGATADDLAWTTHAHPTLPEAMLEAALGFRNAAIHVHSR